jgi:peptidoglycan lytic transglycosylase
MRATYPDRGPGRATSRDPVWYSRYVPSRLGRRAVRRLVRRHRRQPGRPGIRPVVAATALVMVCATTVQLGVLSRTSISTTTAGPATVPRGPLGRVARIVAGAAGPGTVPGPADRAALVVHTSSSSLGCAAGVLLDDTASVTSTGTTCAGGVASVAHEAWIHLREVEARGDRTVRATEARTRSQKRAAERRAQKRAERREQARKAAAKRKAARERAAERRAEKRAERREQARKAARRARQQAQGRGTGWRNAPIVTWYGPGFYGNRTACGVRYTREIVGVAHRTLPCGTLVEFKWHGITAVAPVIDRGPFASSKYVFDFSAAMACEVFKPRSVDNACFTRYDVKYRVVGKVSLKSYLRRQ